MVAQYTVIDNQVYYEHHYTGRTLLAGADAKTLAPLSDPVVTGYFAGWHFAAKDRATVWFMNRPVLDADPMTFTYYWGGQCHWGVDQRYIYCCYVSSKPSVKVIKTGNPTHFRFLPEETLGAYTRQYALDGKYVYYYGRRVLKARPEHFCNIPKDQLHEGFAGSDYYRDDQAVFWRGKRVTAADPATLRVFHLPGLGHEVYAFDQHAFYCAGQRLDTLPTLLQQLPDLATYVAARPEYRAAYWARLGI